MAEFTLVLAGGGARGFAHAGVLRALEREGLRPAAIVGVSMGAVVAATYALRGDWYEALMAVDTGRFPSPGGVQAGRSDRAGRLRTAFSRVHAAWNMLTGWGAPVEAVDAGKAVLEQLFEDHDLDAGRIPVVVCATDLLGGTRVEFRSGLARDLVYASCALAGILPPARIDGHVLVDGVYADIAPVDVARALRPEVVIAVDPGQRAAATDIGNGIQAVMRAVEICHLNHAELRIQEADLVIRPEFGRYIDTLDFDARQECVAAGVRAARERMSDVQRLLSSGEATPDPTAPASGPHSHG